MKRWWVEMRPVLAAGVGSWYADIYPNCCPLHNDNPGIPNLRPLADYLVVLLGRGREEWEHQGLVHVCGWSPKRLAAHMTARMLFRANPHEVKHVPAAKAVAAFLGPTNRTTVAPFITSDVLAALKAANRPVFLPVVADMLQDTGMPEEHPVLARCRDPETPFIPGEWLHQEVMREGRRRRSAAA